MGASKYNKAEMIRNMDNQNQRVLCVIKSLFLNLRNVHEITSTF
ncbi:MAG: hypothetical protein DSZ09_05630 [Sulfurovum sp.]|nr:MAG: hypothetical protein DSZ09_05630 [Sulfurovum sp.]